MKKWIIYFQLAFLVLLFSGCTSVSQKPTVKKPANKQEAWQARQTKSAKIIEWRLQGKVAITHGQQNWPFRISWLQRKGADYEMNIKHPLTSSVLAHLKSNAQGVTMKAQDGKVYRANDAETLLQRQLRVSLPLKGMKYWVRGVGSPDYTKAKASLDEYGRPLTLLQSGWKIEYPVYQTGGTYALPEKVILTNTSTNTRIKVIAKDWQARY